MLKDNIKAARQKCGLSQEELAEKLHVVRQTVSKWEQGLSVPDAELLVNISTVLGVSVETLLGENIVLESENQLKDITQKLIAIEEELNHRCAIKRKLLHAFFIIASIVIMVVFGILCLLGSPDLSWDYGNPETAVMRFGFHAFEWLFVRIAPIILIGAIVGSVLTRKNTRPSVK